MTTALAHLPPVPTARLPLSWLERYGDDLYGFAVRRVRRPETAEDLVQDTLLAGMQGWAAFAERSSVKTWLTGILRHKIADHFRAHYRHETPETGIIDEESAFDRRGHWKSAISRWDGDPQKLAELSEFRTVLGDCVSKLPARMAYLFTRRAENTASTRELCDELAITNDHAWILLHRARLRLRACLTTRWFSDSPALAQMKAE